MSKNEVALAEDLSTMYPVLSADSDVAEVLAENLGGDDFSPHELDQLKTPSGGGSAWEIESLDGETEIMKVVNGIIVHTQMRRAFYETELDEGGGNNPPDCSSEDGVTGKCDDEVGLGGVCADCPHSQYATALKGKGQRCKQSRVMYVMRPGSFLPIVIKVPASSLKAAKKYLLKLAGAGKVYTSVITSFGLEKLKNDDGIDYSGILFSMKEKLSPEHAASAKAISASLKKSVER